MFGRAIPDTAFIYGARTLCRRWSVVLSFRGGSTVEWKNGHSSGCHQRRSSGTGLCQSAWSVYPIAFLRLLFYVRCRIATCFPLYRLLMWNLNAVELMEVFIALIRARAVAKCFQSIEFHLIRLPEVISRRILLRLAGLIRGGSCQSAILETGPKQQKAIYKTFPRYRGYCRYALVGALSIDELGPNGRCLDFI